SGNIGGVELPHNLLAISPWVSSHPVILVKVEKLVNVGDSMALCEDSALPCNNSGNLLFAINHLGIPIDLPLAHNTPSLVASSDEAACSLWLDLVADLALDPKAWADSDPET
ncbi:hypothetical protein H5410_051586, partial [Solanum commersonii]